MTKSSVAQQAIEEAAPSPAMEDAGLRQHQETLHEVKKLRAEIISLHREQAYNAGQLAELRTANLRLQQEAEHYRRIAVAAATAVDQLYTQVSNLHQSIPAMEMEDYTRPDEGTVAVIQNLKSDRKE